MNNRLDQFCGDLAETLVAIHQANWPDYYHYVCITHGGDAIIVSSKSHTPNMIDAMPAWHIHTAYPSSGHHSKPAPSYRDALANLFQSRILNNPFALAAVACRMAENA